MKNTLRKTNRKYNTNEPLKMGDYVFFTKRGWTTSLPVRVLTYIEKPVSSDTPFVEVELPSNISDSNSSFIVPYGCYRGVDGNVYGKYRITEWSKVNIRRKA